MIAQRSAVRGERKGLQKQQSTFDKRLCTEKRRVKYQDRKQIQSQNEEQFEVLDVRGAAKHMQCSQPQDRLIPQDCRVEDADAPSLPQPAHIQVPEIAHRLGIGRLKVYAMLEAGLIPGIHFGRKWIITRFAYENWERTCGVNPSPVALQ